MTPLIERDEAEIAREAAAFFGVPADHVRVTKAQLPDGRAVAYLRVVWTPGTQPVTQAPAVTARHGPRPWKKKSSPTD